MELTAGGGYHRVDKSNHIDAIKYLEAALHSKQLVNFGTMGHGLNPRSEPCIFDSRALQMYVDGGVTAVLSFYNRI